jgi:hypothetical protein
MEETKTDPVEVTPAPKKIGPSLPSPPPEFDWAESQRKRAGIESSIAGIESERATATQAELERMRQSAATREPMHQALEQAHGQLAADARNIPGPEPKPAAPSGPLIDPEQFQSFFGPMWIFSLLLGKVAKGDMNDGLNMLSSGITGYVTGNKERAAYDIEQWKNKTEAAFNAERDKMAKYKAIIENDKFNIQSRMQMLEIEAMRDDDKRMQFALMNKSWDATIKAYQSQEQMLQKQEDSAQKFYQHLNDGIEKKQRAEEHEEFMLALQDARGVDARKLERVKQGEGAGGGGGYDQSSLHGEDYLRTLSAQERDLVKGIAEGRINPNSLSIRGGHRERILGHVTRYDPGYNQQRYGLTEKAVNAFNVGRQSNNVRSFNVALEHLDTLQDLGDALNNRNLQAFNKAANFWKTQTGQEAPSNFEGAKQLVAAEIVKAITATGGGVTDREEAQKTVSAASSPQQLAGIINTYKSLFVGQLHGLEEQYVAATGRSDFKDKYLTAKARKEFARFNAPPADPRGTYGQPSPYQDQEKERRYQEWKRQHGQ